MRPLYCIYFYKSIMNFTYFQINIILPLSGRTETFRGFMKKLTGLVLRHDRRLFLTVVYFGTEGLREVRNIITSASREAKFRHIKLLTLNETFSRGKALQVCMCAWVCDIIRGVFWMSRKCNKGNIHEYQETHLFWDSLILKGIVTDE